MPKLQSMQRKKLEAATLTYQKQLRDEGGACQKYLLSRGMTPEILEEYRLGLVIRPHVGYEMYQGCLAIPYLDPERHATDIRFKPLRSTDTRYLTMPGHETSVYNTKVLVEKYSVFAICEGELDAIIATCYAGVGAVGFPGVNTWKPEYIHLFDGKTVLLLGDGDDSGRLFNERLNKILGDHARTITFPEGYDVNSYCVTYGSEMLRMLLFPPDPSPAEDVVLP